MIILLRVFVCLTFVIVPFENKIPAEFEKK